MCGIQRTTNEPINQQTQLKQSQRQQGHTGGCQRGGVEGWVTRVRGLRRTDWKFRHSHGDVKCSTGELTVIITFCSARRVLGMSGGTLVKCMLI